MSQLTEYLIDIGFRLDEQSEKKLFSSLRRVEVEAQVVAESIEYVAETVADYVVGSAQHFSDLFFAAVRLRSTAEELDNWGKAAEAAGYSSAAVRSMLTRLHDNLANLPGLEDRLKHLGVSIRDVTGKLLTTGEIAQLIIKHFAEEAEKHPERYTAIIHELAGFGPTKEDFEALKREEFQRALASITRINKETGYDVGNFEAGAKRLNNAAKFFRTQLSIWASKLASEAMPQATIVFKRFDEALVKFTPAINKAADDWGDDLAKFHKNILTPLYNGMVGYAQSALLYLKKIQVWITEVREKRESSGKPKNIAMPTSGIPLPKGIVAEALNPSDVDWAKELPVLKELLVETLIPAWTGMKLAIRLLNEYILTDKVIRAIFGFFFPGAKAAIGRDLAGQTSFAGGPGGMGWGTNVEPGATAAAMGGGGGIGGLSFGGGTAGAGGGLGGGGGGVGAATPAAIQEAMTAAMDQLRKEGVPEGNLKAAAAMLVGQAIKESGLNPRAVHDQGTGYGIYGARDGGGILRRTRMINWLKAHGYEVNSVGNQMREMAHSAMTGGYINTRWALMNATPQNIGPNTNVVTREFENPKGLPFRADAVQHAFSIGPMAMPEATLGVGATAESKQPPLPAGDLGPPQVKASTNITINSGGPPPEPDVSDHAFAYHPVRNSVPAHN